MAAGDTTQGSRRPDGTELHELKPGEYAFAPNGETLWLCLPNGLHGAVTRDRWTITSEGEGPVTVDPSIETTGGSGAEHYWHGYLKHGVWSEV